MFEGDPAPRLFGVPPGVDFATAVVDGLRQRSSALAPEQLAQVEVYVNSGRMQRRVRAAFDTGPASLVPRIRPLTALAQDVAIRGVPPAASSLRVRLELSQLVSALLTAQPDLAPRAAIYDLADSLAGLLSEMQDEGVPPEAILSMTVDDQSGHWERNLSFIKLVEQYFDATALPSAEARQRLVVERLIADWRSHPPAHPILIAGSTGSRGTTAMLMQAVAELPQGALILPGFDFAQPAAVWDGLIDASEPSDDHPQYRYARLMRQLGVPATSVSAWTAADTPCPERNALTSLALRPAPVTDQWRSEGPAFTGIGAATEGIALIEAPSPRVEAGAIALCIRGAVERRQTVALISPDRSLTRQVTAALDRWEIEPDDSAGEPLSQTAPGRLFRHVAALFGRRLTLEALIVLLKHPLVLAGSELRGMHLLWTRELELWARRRGPAFPDKATLIEWAGTSEDGRLAWITWVTEQILGYDEVAPRHLVDHLDTHLTLTRALVAGPDGVEDELWAKPAGRAARQTLTELQVEAPHGGTMSARDYESLFYAVLSRGEVRDPDAPRPDVTILGTLEARVQSADLVILAGLNDGIWPGIPAPDQWFNREMRRRTGLNSPEQRIGLAAHDFQIALGAGQVVLSRAVRDADSQTVPSRWLNRITNLLDGMSADGKAGLEQMRGRGRYLIDLAEKIDQPSRAVPRAKRPSPKPPVKARPRKLSVTKIQKLVLDPFAIYAEQILKLRPLDPLRREPEAPLRGTIIHGILEKFVLDTLEDNAGLTREHFLEVARQALLKDAPWPATRRLWQVRLDRIADHFIETERMRRSRATPLVLEAKGEFPVAEIDFVLTGTADRIDVTPSGELIIYDYKTGVLPAKQAVLKHDKQLVLEAAMAGNGAFEGIAPSPVASVEYIGLGSAPEERSYPITPDEIDRVLDEFRALIRAYDDPRKGYTSLRAGKQLPYTNPYDHLARYGEWETSDLPQGEDVG